MAKKTTTIFERGAFNLDNLQAINKAQEEEPVPNIHIQGKEEEGMKRYIIQSYLTAEYIKKYEKIYTKFILSISRRVLKKNFLFIMVKAYAIHLEEKGLLKTPPDRDFVPNLLRRLGRRKNDGEKKEIYVFCHCKRIEEYNLLDDVMYSLAQIIDDPVNVLNQTYYYITMIDYFEAHIKEIITDYNNNPEKYTV